ncbi:hypothetical protein HQ560_20100, partial [bacterium]|nr:hypothetical protein [bacterium]
MHTREKLVAGLVVGMVLVLTGVAQAVSIGVNFGSNRTGASLAAGDSAGVVAQTNWNNAPNASGSFTDATDSSGGATLVDVSWATSESWSHSGGAATSDGVLMKGWASANNNSTAGTVSISNIPYAKYALYLYVSHDRNNDDTRFTETGGALTNFVTREDASNSTIDDNPFVFNEITTSGGVGNYTKVSGLTQSSLWLNLYPNAASSDRGPLSGLQIVTAPPEGGVVSIAGITGHQQGDSATGNGSILTTINGAGITKPDPLDPGTWTHNSAWQTDWQGSFPGGAAQDADQGWAVVDLGRPKATEFLYLWNVNESNALDRGTQDFDLYYAVSPIVTPPAVGGAFQPYDFSSGGWTKLGDILSLAQGTGSDAMAVNGMFDISGAWGARYIGIDILSNYGSTWRAGLSEIAVTSLADVPEPATLSLLALG